MDADEFYDKQKMLLDKVPVEFRSFISYKCYEDHHSSGYEEVLDAVKDLVYGLSICIENYTSNKCIKCREDY